jgi:hypothetical protein
MKWKNFPLWLKVGLLVPAVVLIIFIIGGLIVLVINQGSCSTPPCSAGSGSCPSTFLGCFSIYNNYMELLLILPTKLIFFSSPLMITVYNYLSSIFFNVFQTELFLEIILNLILYFGIGSLVGLIIQKIKYRKKS